MYCGICAGREQQQKREIKNQTKTKRREKPLHTIRPLLRLIGRNCGLKIFKPITKRSNGQPNQSQKYFCERVIYLTWVADPRWGVHSCLQELFSYIVWAMKYYTFSLTIEWFGIAFTAKFRQKFTFSQSWILAHFSMEFGRSPEKECWKWLKLLTSTRALQTITSQKTLTTLIIFLTGNLLWPCNYKEHRNASMHVIGWIALSTSVLNNWGLGPVSRKSRKLFGPEKPFVKLPTACFGKPIF